MGFFLCKELSVDNNPSHNTPNETESKTKDQDGEEINNTFKQLPILIAPKINLKNQGLPLIPDELYKMANPQDVVEINLEKNFIPFISSNFEIFNNLVTLKLNQNAFKTVPPPIYNCGLVNIQLLFLNNNEIDELPDLSNLVHLKQLYLQNNKISNNKIENLDKLSSLIVLNLGQNNLDQIPP